MNILKIGEKAFTVIGNVIKVIGRSIFVDNVLIDSNLEDTVKIEFIGDLASLDCGDAVIYGNVDGDVDGGDITIDGNVGGLS